MRVTKRHDGKQPKKRWLPISQSPVLKIKPQFPPIIESQSGIAPRSASSIAAAEIINAPHAQLATPRIFVGKFRPNENMTNAVSPGMTDVISRTVRRSKAGIGP